MKDQITLYDTTMRDGTQGEYINLTAEDKFRIAKKLDDFGIPYVEGGWPGSNPKDCLLYTSPSPRDRTRSRMPSSA